MQVQEETHLNQIQGTNSQVLLGQIQGNLGTRVLVVMPLLIFLTPKVTTTIVSKGQPSLETFLGALSMKMPLMGLRMILKKISLCICLEVLSHQNLRLLKRYQKQEQSHLEDLSKTNSM